MRSYMKVCKIFPTLTIVAGTLAGCKSIGARQKTIAEVRLTVTYISQNPMCVMEDGKMPQPATKSDTVIARKHEKTGDFLIEKVSADSISGNGQATKPSDSYISSFTS